MAPIISIGILLLFFMGLLLLPIRIEIDTSRETFIHISIGGIFHGSTEVSAEGWLLTFQGMGFKKRINLLEDSNTTKKQPPEKAKKRTGYFPSPLPMIRAFRLQKLEWRLDTGDFLKNAQLYPVFGLLSHGPVVLSINFNGQNTIILHAYTRLIYLSTAFIRSRIK